jgi:hypothetical protein
MATQNSNLKSRGADSLPEAGLYRSCLLLRKYNSSTLFGSSKRSLSEAISAITGISKVILLSRSIASVSVATRMSWASKRATTKQEDQAYCLLGIFGINTQPIYGKGMNKAFIRLQEETVKEINDHSFFAWNVPSKIDIVVRHFGICTRMLL